MITDIVRLLAFEPLSYIEGAKGRITRVDALLPEGLQKRDVDMAYLYATVPLKKYLKYCKENS